MAKGKKVDDKPKEGATLLIDVDSFVSTRDSVVKGLATLQDAIRTLSSAYINHTNAVLGEHAPGLDVDSVLAKLSDNPLISFGDLNNNRAPSPAKSVTAAEPATDKKERKKRQHDPNAPKRPLTPFFLYMQTARPIISNDLGPEVPKGAVSAEGTRRWGTMAQEDKQLWTDAYKDNLKLYNARMHSYKHGNANAKDMTDTEAATYAEEHNISNDNTADAQLVGESSAAALNDEDAEGEPEPEKEPTPPPKTPKAKSSRKSKTSKAAEEAEAAPPPPSSSSIVPPKAAAAAAEKEKEKSPDKKRKRASKKGAEEVVASTEKEELAVETPKSIPKPRKKAKKSDA